MREGGDARQPAQEVQRRPLAREDRPQSAAHDRDDRPALDAGAVLEEGIDLHLGIERPEHRLDRVDPADDAGLLQEERRGPQRVRVDDRLGGDVAAADVFGEGVQDDPLDGGGRYSHVSSTGS